MYSPLEGQAILIVDAVLILFLLISEHIPMKKPFWFHSLLGLCWGVIVVATEAVQCVKR